MIKRMRAKDLVARFLNKRPDYESYTAYSRRLGLTFVLTFNKLMSMKDVEVGLLYQILKDKGYALMAYNPNPPEGMASCYTIDNTYAPVGERKEKKVRIIRDPYTNELYRKKRRYRKDEYKKFVRIK